MPLIFIGKSGIKRVFVTPDCWRRFRQRNLKPKEVLHMLEHRHISYPIDQDGRQKVRVTLPNGKKAFLTIFEDTKKVLVITGGES